MSIDPRNGFIRAMETLDDYDTNQAVDAQLTYLTVVGPPGRGEARGVGASVRQVRKRAP